MHQIVRSTYDMHEPFLVETLGFLFFLISRKSDIISSLGCDGKSPSTGSLKPGELNNSFTT